MPVSEDVIIRILTDATSGIREIKKTDAELKKMGATAKLSAKNLVSIGAAFGGVTALIDLGVKAVTAYVQKLNEMEDAYVEAMKAGEEGTEEQLKTYTDLEKAMERYERLRGEEISKNRTWWREQKTQRLQRKADDIEYGDTAMDLLEEQERQILIMGTAWEGTQMSYREYVEYVKNNPPPDPAGDPDNYTGGNQYENFVARMIEDNKDVEISLSAWKRQQIAVFGELGRIEEYADAMNLIGIEVDESALKIQFLEQVAEALVNDGFAKWAGFLTGEGGISQMLAELNGEIERFGNSATVFITSAGNAIDDAFDTQNAIDNLNVLGTAVSGFVAMAFGDTKAGAIAQAIINQALAITNIWTQFAAYPPLAAALTGIAVAATGVQIAKIKSQDYALGTPPGGFVVPPGYEGDGFPMNVSSGERVTVDRPGASNNQMLQASINIDGYEFGQVITRLFDDRKATISGIST